MPKPSKNDVRVPRSEHQKQTGLPTMPIAELEERLRSELSPAVLGRAQLHARGLNLRDRILNVAAMAAILLSIVYRRLPSLRQTLETLDRENLLWLEARSLSVEALSKRLDKMPAEIFAVLFAELLEARRTRVAQSHLQMIKPELAHLLKHFAAIVIADASTLEQLKRTTTQLRQDRELPNGGKMLMIVDALTHQPLHAFYQSNARVNEKTFSGRIIEALAPSAAPEAASGAASAPLRPLAILDCGFFSYAFFEELSNASISFVTRIMKHAHVEVDVVLGSSDHYRDELIHMGTRGHPCALQLRRVSVLWGRTWYHYLSNELDPTRLSARDIAMLYRTRWRIEDAFKTTKRLLGLTYLWSGNFNGVELQMYATWIIYSLLIDICTELAIALRKPIEQISVEKVFRTLYHYQRAQQDDQSLRLIDYLQDHVKLHALVKAERKRHRQRDAMLRTIWESPPYAPPVASA